MVLHSSTRFTARLAMLALCVAGCSPKQPPTPNPDDAFVHEKLPVHCFSSVSGDAIYRLGPNPETFAMDYWDQTGVANTAKSGLVTHDSGRTFTKLVGLAIDDPQGVAGDHSLARVNHPLYVGDDFWVAELGPALLSGGTSGEVITAVLDGRVHLVPAAPKALTLASGVTSEVVFTLDATRSVARSGPFLYSSRDSGNTWTALGPSPQWKPDNLWLRLIASKDGVAVYNTEQDQYRAFWAELGKPPREIKWKPTREKLVTPKAAAFFDGKFWNTTWSEVQVSDDATTFTTVPTRTDGPTGTELFVDAQNQLWAYPKLSVDSPEQFILYRWSAGQTQPVIVDMDFGGLHVANIMSMIDGPAGHLRLLAQTGAPGKHGEGLLRDASRWVLCEAGPDVTASYEPIVTEPIAAAVSSDRVVRTERFTDGSTLGEVMAFAPSGKTYVIKYESIWGTPSDAPHIYAAQDVPNPSSSPDGINPQALFNASETSVSAVMHTGSDGVTGPNTVTLTFDAETGQSSHRTVLPFRESFLEIFDVFGKSMYRTEDTLVRSDLLQPGDQGELPPKWKTSLVLNGRFAAIVENLGSYDPGYQTKTLRFNPLTTPVPNIDTCRQSPAPSGCVDQSKTTPYDAEIATDGTLYLLDGALGRVMMLAPDSNAYVEVANGFVAPADLALRDVAGKTVVLVLDGDVFAFSPEPGKIKTRGAGQAPAPLVPADLRARDRRDCIDSGPCIDTPPESGIPQVAGVVDLATNAQACITGKNFGATAGKVLLETNTASVKSWADTKICIAPSAGAISGRLRVVRDDGVASNRIAYMIKPTVTGFEIPETVYVDTPLRVKGTGLLNAFLSAGQPIIAQGDGYIDTFPGGAGVTSLLVGFQGHQLSQSPTFDAKPRVTASCRSAHDEPCEVVGVGFGSIGIVTATVDGLSAPVDAASDFQVRFRWPAGLAPGVHHAVLTRGPIHIETDVTLDDTVSEVMVAGQPTASALRWAHSRGIRTQNGLVVPLDVWDIGFRAGTRTPIALQTVLLSPFTHATDGRLPLPMQQAGDASQLRSEQPVQIAPTAGGFYAVGSDLVREDRLIVVRDTRSAPDGNVTHEILAPFAVQNSDRAAAISEFHSRVLLVSSNTLLSKSRVYDTVASAGALTVASSVEVPYSNMVGSRIVATDAWISPVGVYLGSCRQPHLRAELWFLPVSTNGDGSLAFGTPQQVLTSDEDHKNDRILACNATSDGFAWVLRDATGEHLQRHTVANGVTQVATLPADLPGVGQSFTYSSDDELPGVQDLTLLSSGDWMLLANADTGAQRGLRLLRRHSDGSFSSSAIIAPSLLAQLGESCVGPVLQGNVCSRIAMDGCSPLACSVSPFQQIWHDTDHIGEAQLIDIDAQGNASIVYEATTTAPRGIYAQTDVHAISLPVPP